jgi:OOP family OmpA-OmpF porin
MKKIILLFVVFLSWSYAKGMIRVLPDATNSNVSEEVNIADEDRPKGFIIRHVKDDIDNDGIKDENDECLDTPSGKVVDKNGCTKVIVLKVRFDFDKYNIKDEYKDEIKEAVLLLKNHPNYKVMVEGHTDSKGTNEYNYILSELRAKKVALAIVNDGIDSKRVTTKGYGKTVPIATNDTEEGRAKNRRVEISFNKR